MGWWKNLKDSLFKEETDIYLEGLGKSRDNFANKLKRLSIGFKGIDEDFLEEIMIVLLEADVGIHTANKIIDLFVKKTKNASKKEFNELMELLIEAIEELYGDVTKVEEHYPKVILLVGVNGNGKTTSAGKLAHMYQRAGKKVLLAAADTFRAGAVDQLCAWADKLDTRCITGKENGDPSAVLVDACRVMKQEGYDVLIGDTAGRLQNKVNLMNELNKMKRVVSREIENEPSEVLLVLDATTGQNGVEQAKNFMESAAVNGIVLTKMDGTAKGGVVLAIKDQLGIDVRYIGFGEGEDDLKEFDMKAYLYGLCDGLVDND